jgi:hypothetical protein
MMGTRQQMQKGEVAVRAAEGVFLFLLLAFE